ncbi:MAG: lipopolysaccharide biosynthesis protein [Bacteroidales bacterium]|nr:lipopolysaccharide biosynthesis protein [Bacteroidales bacterium]
MDKDFSLENDGLRIENFKFFPKTKGNSSYFFDTYEYVRFFPVANKFSFVFGDVTHVPSIPSFVKSRPVVGDNKNSVVLKLNKLRHFVFVKDRIPFHKKDNKIIFYNSIAGRPHRIDFMKKYFGHSECICGDTSHCETIPKEWFVKKISLKKHLKHKFVLSLEGNDVATNLKWVMSSNSLAVMPKPKYETWFMEGRLIPDFHYVEIKDDYSDMIERMNYYIEHPAEAEKIIKNANEYVSRFKNKKREKIISLMVIKKYFDKVFSV